MILSTAQMRKMRLRCASQSWFRGQAYEWQNWPYWLLLWVPTRWLLLRSPELIDGSIEKNYFENKLTPVLSASPHSAEETLSPPISLALSYKDKNILSLSLTGYLLHWTSWVIFSTVILSVTCLLLSARQSQHNWFRVTWALFSLSINKIARSALISEFVL